MGRTPLLLPLIGIVGGILAAGLLPGCSLWIVFLITLAGVAGAFMRLGAPAFFLLFFGIGWSVAELNAPQPLAWKGNYLFSGEVLRARPGSGSGMSGIVRVDSVDGFAVQPFKSSVYLIGHDRVIEEGNRITFRADMSGLRPQPEIPDCVDFNSALRREGVVGYAMILPDSLLSQTESAGIFPAFRRLNRAAKARLLIPDISPATFSLLSAMLLGDRSDIMPSEVDTYSAAGISHLLALSGTHVAVIVMVVSFALWPLYFARRNKPKWFITILVLWFYALLTGMSPSVVRAVIIASVFLLGRILERDSVPLNSLCLAAILILLFAPADLYAPGFQMSFAAVAGIILFYPLLNRINRRKHPVLYFLWSYPALSVSAMLFTSVVSAWYFHIFPLWFLFANLIAVPLVPLIIICGVILIAVPNIPLISGLADMLCDTLNSVARVISSLPLATAEGLYLPLWLTLALIGLLLMFALGCHARRLSVMLASVILCIGAFALEPLTRPSYPEFEYFPVSQSGHTHVIVRSGDSLTLYTPLNVNAEREELRRFYSEMLRDYMGHRGLDSLSLWPEKECRTLIIGSDTLEIR